MHTDLRDSPKEKYLLEYKSYYRTRAEITQCAPEQFPRTYEILILLVGHRRWLEQLQELALSTSQVRVRGQEAYVPKKGIRADITDSAQFISLTDSPATLVSSIKWQCMAPSTLCFLRKVFVPIHQCGPEGSEKHSTRYIIKHRLLLQQ